MDARARAFSFLADKLAPPDIQVEVLRRRRLLDQLTRSAGHRVTVVCAPAGAGKTTLLATWYATARSRGSARLGWLSLDDSDNDPQVFWAYVVEALRLPGVGRTADPLSALDEPAVVNGAFLDRFLATLGGLPERVVLVLDDVHRLRNPVLLAGLDRVLRHAPARLHVVLGGRRAPDLPLARLRVAGDLADIGARDLACTAGETAELLGVLGVSLAEGDVELMLRRTGGWLIGLRLAALWWHGVAPAGRRDLAAFSGHTPLVTDYLRDEFLRVQRTEVRAFLLRTCLVDTVCGDLADRLTGRHDGARTLEELAHQDGLLTAVGPEREWFAYNPLLHDFLRAQLACELPDEIRSLHRRAARWYARHRLVKPALTAAADAGDWGLVTRLLVEAGRPFLASADPAEVNGLLDRVPARLVRADSGLALVYAGVRLAQRDPEGAEGYLRIAEGMSAPAESLAYEGELRRCELRLQQAMLRGQVAVADLNHATMLLSRAALPAEPRARPAAVALAVRVGLGRMWNGDAVAARDAFGLALRWESDPGSAREALLTSWYSLLNAVDGRLSAVGRGRPAAAMRPLDALGQAIAAYERDQLAEAWTLVQPDPLVTGTDLEFPAAAVVHLLRARILALRGELDSARAELVRSRLDQTGVLAAQIAHYAGLVEAAMVLRQGDSKAARRILVAAVEGAPVSGLAVDAVAMGRLCLAEHDAEAALEAIWPCLDGTASGLRLVDSVAAHLVSGAAHRILGKSELAREELELALDLATAEGLVRVFLSSGRAVRSLLTVVLAPCGPYAGMRSLLLHQFERQAATLPQPRGAEAPPLTPSEQHVLRYLPSHLTNEEIAEDLYLSVNTVKSHLRTLYRKLNVVNRREAIAKGQQLGLLE